MVKAAVSLCGIELDNPVIPASGTFGYGYTFAELYDINCLGTFSFKGTTREQRLGNAQPRIAEAPGGMLNAVGLQNPGVDAVIAEELPRLKQVFHKPVMANVSGFSIEEYVEVCRKLDACEQVGWLEVNISCPNVHGGGLAFGTDPKAAASVTRAVKAAVKKPVIVKLSPNVTSIADIARACEDAGADAVSLINTVLGTAYEMGFTKNDVVVDGLVATVGAQKDAAINCLKTINYCYNNGLATICGLSNISFGLPERMFVNTAFLTMAISRGLTMAIANPSQTMLMNAAFASDMLLFKEESDVRYIENVKPLELASPGAGASGGKAGSDLEGKSQIYIDVLKGNKRSILDDVHAVLDSGADPQSIIDNDLIGAINEVGRLFEKKKYFLPQLISSAETMEMAIGVISPLVLKDKDSSDMPTIVVATVEGDIHDIGKNLVVLMLRNYGFNVIDLGKDVPCDVIIQAAKDNNASIIGLSALMTTTMVKMKDVVEAVKENGLDSKVVIGGAVITESYAEEIGADGYSEDAANCVVVVKNLLGIE